MFLEQFKLPGREKEEQFLMNEPRLLRTCYSSVYPFQVFSFEEFGTFYFAPITVLYGNNGSGKTSLLNIIAEKLNIKRDIPFNHSPFFNDYVKLCQIQITGEKAPKKNKVIASDDVFAHLLNKRDAQRKMDETREQLLSEYQNYREKVFRFSSLGDLEEVKKINEAKNVTGSKFVNRRLLKNPRLRSNGESAFRFFTEQIQEDGLYLLDEPENSLSPLLQTELKRYIQDSARFFGCQFIIATHSPFFLSLEKAKIYDLDCPTDSAVKWFELENMKAYFQLFLEHQKIFEE